MTTTTPQIDDLRSQIVKLESDLVWQQERYDELKHIVDQLAVTLGDAIVGMSGLSNVLAKRCVKLAEEIR